MRTTKRLPRCFDSNLNARFPVTRTNVSVWLMGWGGIWQLRFISSSLLYLHPMFFILFCEAVFSISIYEPVFFPQLCVGLHVGEFSWPRAPSAWRFLPRRRKKKRSKNTVTAETSVETKVHFRFVFLYCPTKGQVSFACAAVLLFMKCVILFKLFKKTSPETVFYPRTDFFFPSQHCKMAYLLLWWFHIQQECVLSSVQLAKYSVLNSLLLVR